MKELKFVGQLIYDCLIETDTKDFFTITYDVTNNYIDTELNIIIKRKYTNSKISKKITLNNHLLILKDNSFLKSFLKKQILASIETYIQFNKEQYNIFKGNRNMKSEENIRNLIKKGMIYLKVKI